MMEPIYLLSLASHKSSWLAAREATIAGNIANANTPGYKAKDLADFSEVLNATQLGLVSTNAGHLVSGGLGDPGAAKVAAEAWDVSESGNSVGMEQELLKAGQVSSDYSLTTNIVKSFHAMLMSAVKE